MLPLAGRRIAMPWLVQMRVPPSSPLSCTAWIWRSDVWQGKQVNVKRISDVVRWLEQAPPETMLPAHSVLALIREAVPEGKNAAIELSPASTWRERLWSAPPETRLGVEELSDAIGRPKSWIYRHTSAKSGLELLPHRRLDGALVFLVGEIRKWVAEHEATVVPAHSQAVSLTRRLQR